MEGALNGEKSLTPSKQIQVKPKRKTHNHHYHKHQPVPHMEMMHGHGGVFLNPRTSFSLSSSLSLPANYHQYHLSPNNYPHHPSTVFPPQQRVGQPPLLPLPIFSNNNNYNKPTFYSLPPPTTRSSPSLSPPSTKKQPTKKPKKQAAAAASKAIKGGGEKSPPPTKPVVEDLPKEVTTRVSLGEISGVSDNVVGGGGGGGGDDEFLGSSSVFTLSPPPSSLPLPKFSLRPKLSCTVEAASEVDDGATDSLRRILKIR